MQQSPPQHPMGAAMQWVARIMGAGIMMVLPGLAGQWLDGQFGTGFLALVGFALGVALSIAYLIAITKPSVTKPSVTKPSVTKPSVTKPKK